MKIKVKNTKIMESMDYIPDAEDTVCSLDPVTAKAKEFSNKQLDKVGEFYDARKAIERDPVEGRQKKNCPSTVSIPDTIKEGYESGEDEVPTGSSKMEVNSVFMSDHQSFICEFSSEIFSEEDKEETLKNLERFKETVESITFEGASGKIDLMSDTDDNMEEFLSESVPDIVYGSPDDEPDPEDQMKWFAVRIDNLYDEFEDSRWDRRVAKKVAREVESLLHKIADTIQNSETFERNVWEEPYSMLYHKHLLPLVTALYNKGGISVPDIKPLLVKELPFNESIGMINYTQMAMKQQGLGEEIKTMRTRALKECVEDVCACYLDRCNALADEYDDGYEVTGIPFITQGVVTDGSDMYNDLVDKYVGKTINVGTMVAPLCGVDDSCYNKGIGVVKDVDENGILHGTWGDLNVIPGVDDFYIIEV